MRLRPELEEVQTDAALTLVMLITLMVSPSARRILTPVCNKFWWQRRRTLHRRARTLASALFTSSLPSLRRQSHDRGTR